VCQNGAGSFSATSSTGAAAYVGTRKVEGFGSRDCELLLRWNRQELVAVPHAWQLDVDAMDIDLGLGAPVLALQMKPTEVDRTSTYQIYSLKQPPHLLREISGGDDYSAADTELDGHVEIWTHDAQAVDGFEDFPLSSFDFPPTVVLRFEKRGLMDASAEFRAEFDRQIAAVKAQLNPQQLSAFKASDGTLAATPPSSVEELHSLMAAKIGVLEIVFAYLYSGREDQAWQTLRDLWPAADYDRIRAEIAAARSRGILRQVDGAGTEEKRLKIKHQTAIYKAPSNRSKPSLEPAPSLVRPSPATDGRTIMASSGNSDEGQAFIADTAPVQIDLYMKGTSDEDEAPLETQRTVHLLIDDAGKVHSIKFDGPPDQRIKDSIAGWRFIPALKNGHPVACSLDLSLSSPR
jgi:hypothetical protein